MRFAKGHGTGNDFLILPDPDDQLRLSSNLIIRLCDRRTGLGADGILRVVRMAARDSGAPVPSGSRAPAPSGAPQQPPGQAPEWFMDYRNADGTVAQMCGNGIRVFARYLLDHGLATGPVIAVATRAGVRQVRLAEGGEFAVDMGAVQILGPGSAVVGGRACRGVAISVGNPHLACLVDAPVASFDLSSPPVLDPGRFPDGANVEIVRRRGDGELEMRVYERGSGVTLSCGTGAVAAAAAAATATATATAAGGGTANGGSAGDQQVSLSGSWTVQVPGGQLVVTLGETSVLSGPAVIVAEGELTDGWLARQA